MNIKIQKSAGIPSGLDTPVVTSESNAAETSLVKTVIEYRRNEN